MVPTIPGGSTGWVFVGPTVEITTLTGQRLTGAATAPLAHGVSVPNAAQLDLCYQPTTGGPLLNFSGADFSIAEITSVRRNTAVATTVVPGAGTWNVGMCLVHLGTAALNNNHKVNGWVQVTP